MRLLLADDQERVRSAINLVLKHESEIQIVGEVDNTEQIIPMIKKTRPDILLLDWEMAACPVTDLLNAIHAAFPEIITIVMSARGVSQRQALDAGAHALISKTEPPDRLIHLIHQFGNERSQMNI
jgi:DNA-binding NarL/FixJ family response regulator